MYIKTCGFISDEGEGRCTFALPNMDALQFSYEIYEYQ